MAARTDLHLVMESLEQFVSREMASSMVAEAMRLHLAVPGASASAVITLVRGPLRTVIARRLGPEQAGEIVDRIEYLLGPTPPPMAIPPTSPPPRPDQTQSVPTERRPVPVVVVAHGGALTAGLAEALGERRIDAAHAPDEFALARLLDGQIPAVVVIDGSDFAPIEPDALAALLTELPPTSARVVFGANLPYGAAAVAELRNRGLTAVALDRRHGIDPLLDLIRARRREESG